MTDAHLPDRWLSDRRFRRPRLSDSAYRSYMQALMFAVGNRTEGIIEPSDLPFIPDFDPADIPELIGGDLWEPHGRAGERWLMVDFAQTQTGRDLLEMYEKRKAWDRSRKAKQRKCKLAAQLADDDESGGSSTGTVPVDCARPGQARPGQAPKASASKAEPTARNSHVPDF
ncbi:hypothetical protein LAUMK41_00634 [Mycobacterium attenuatum]|nr:hypothetical protein LAUMK41_00634 [Mycobacterium attenuatum]